MAIDNRTALVIGRFQPLHNGHLAAIREIMGKHAKLLLVIGSSQESRTQKNPFTAGERIGMIEEVLKAEGLLPRTTIIELPDANNHGKWVKDVLEVAGKADVTYSGNWLVQKLLKPKYEVHTMRSDVKISATIIRSLISGGKEWKKWVPRQVSDYIVRNKLDKIVK